MIKLLKCQSVAATDHGRLVRVLLTCLFYRSVQRLFRIVELVAVAIIVELSQVFAHYRIPPSASSQHAVNELDSVVM